MSPAGELRQIGVVVHPTRDVEEAFGALRDWAERSGVQVVQVPVLGSQQEVAPGGDPNDCDLIVAIGGDGTTLAAIHGAETCDVPVMGVACGSLGALTAVPSDGVARALERFATGDWQPQHLPALSLELGDGRSLNAFNDVALVRAGEGQVRAAVSVDGDLYVRLAGDGCVISTPTGSSAYSFAAGGPLIAPSTEAFVLTPLTNHGGSCPPLVLTAGSRLRVEVKAAMGGVRLEVDGKAVEAEPEVVDAELQPRRATLVGLADQEPPLTGLRRRGIIIDSPRILAEDARHES